MSIAQQGSCEYTTGEHQWEEVARNASSQKRQHTDSHNGPYEKTFPRNDYQSTNSQPPVNNRAPPSPTQYGRRSPIPTLLNTPS